MPPFVFRLAAWNRHRRPPIPSPSKFALTATTTAAPSRSNYPPSSSPLLLPPSRFASPSSTLWKILPPSPLCDGSPNSPTGRPTSLFILGLLRRRIYCGVESAGIFAPRRLPQIGCGTLTAICSGDQTASIRSPWRLRTCKAISVTPVTSGNQKLTN